MEIKLITTNVTTSGGRVGFRLLGNVEIKKGSIITSPIIFGTTVNPNQKVRFVVNGNTSGVTSNNESYFELYSDGPINSFKTYFAIGGGSNPEIDGSLLRTIDVTNLDTSQITDMHSMFVGCMGLTSLDVSHFDTSKVTNMSGMFIACMGLTSLDLSNWNTSQVTNMSQMFSGCTGLASLDLSNFDTSQVTDMTYMFNGCSGLTSLDVSNFNTSQVTDMSWMFADCSGLTSLDLSNWDTSKVTSMYVMFSGCASLRTIKINDETSANKLIAQIKKDLNKTTTWDSTTKEITIPA